MNEKKDSNVWDKAVKDVFGNSAEWGLSNGNFIGTFQTIASNKISDDELKVVVDTMKQKFPQVKASPEDCLFLLKYFSDDEKLKSQIAQLLGSVDPLFRQMMVDIVHDKNWNSFNKNLIALLKDEATNKTTVGKIIQYVAHTGNLEEKMSIKEHLDAEAVKKLELEILLDNLKSKEDILALLLPYFSQWDQACIHAIKAVLTMDFTGQKDKVRKFLKDVSAYPEADNNLQDLTYLFVYLDPEDWRMHKMKIKAFIACLIRDVTKQFGSPEEINRYKKVFDFIRENKLLEFREDIPVLIEGPSWQALEGLKLIETFDIREAGKAVARLSRSKEVEAEVKTAATHLLERWGGAKAVGLKKMDFSSHKGMLGAMASEGLSDISDKIKNFLFPAIKVIPAKSAKVRLGSSKLGGWPHLPQGIDWPSCDDVPMSFLAQINLSDVGQFDVDKKLPAKGILYFFCDEEHNYEPTDEGHTILFVDDEKGLSEWAPSEVKKKKKPYKEMPVSFKSEISLPSGNFLRHIAKITFSPSEEHQYEQFLKVVGEGSLRKHKLLGHPDSIQDEVISRWDQETLLLQIDSDQKTGMEWGDAGCIYFVIETADVKARRFQNARMDFQSS